jgi:hypothetical protein
MADYYPLIARAVAGLPQNTHAARRALYNRARNALIAQLRDRTPTPGESDITRERRALEDAIQNVEAEIEAGVKIASPARVAFQQTVKAKILYGGIAVLLLPALAFGVRSCYLAEGAYDNVHAPELEFIGATGQQDSVPTFRDSPTFELKFQPIDNRRAFVEVVTDAQYEIKSKESYVGGWGPNQGYWGGTIVDARVVAGKSIVQLRSGQITPGKYWVRTALFVGKTYSGESPFEVTMYNLVGAPIDYKDGYYFLFEGGKRVSYAASRYYPFYMLGNDRPLSGSPIAQTSPESEQLYKVAIERYFNAYIKADLDTLLDALDPAGPMYPKPPAIKQLRETVTSNALQGAATVREIKVIEQSSEKARVSVTMFMRVDVNRDGSFREETSHPTCELRLGEGKWRIFNCST